MTDGTTTVVSTTTESETFEPTAPTTGPVEPLCPVGSKDCPCTPGGFCDASLVCDAGVCREDACPVGALGCACTPGGGCDAPNDCEGGICVKGVSKSCGDADKDEFEECDLGPGNDDAGPNCTTKCALPVCGDGLVQKSINESCDGGPTCSPACSLLTCGNGDLDPMEECEPSAEDDEFCTAACVKIKRRVFVTSQQWAGGELGGVMGADDKCREAAANAALPGEYLSMLSVVAEDAPINRYPKHWFIYVDVFGTPLSPGLSDVGVMTLYDKPLFDENGDPAPDSEALCVDSAGAWAAAPQGPEFNEDMPVTCGGWADINAFGSFARYEFQNSLWSSCFKIECHLKAPIYCVEQ